MPGWARELAEKIRLQEEIRQQESVKTQARKKLFAEKAPEIWGSLVQTLDLDIREFNAVFRDDTRNCATFERFPENLRVPPQRIIVRRKGYVAAQLETSLELDMEGIEFRASRRAAHEGVSHEKKSILKLVMDDGGNVEMRYENRVVTVESASQLLLCSILAP